MTLAAKVEAARKAAAERHERRLVTLDIERLPGQATVRYGGLTITGDFWDLNGWKHVIRRRLDPPEVDAWPRTICAAWRVYGQERIHFTAEWLHGQEGMHQRLWKVLDKADILAGHNANGFDRRHINTGFRDHGMPPPSKYHVLDTLTVARRHFGDESMKLDSLCKRLGIPAKTGKYTIAMAKAAVAGDKAAQQEMQEYNVGDIPASEALATVELPWATGLPHIAPKAGREANICPRCASDNVKRDGVWSPAVYAYPAYRCKDCGGSWYVGEMQYRNPSARAL